MGGHHAHSHAHRAEGGLDEPPPFVAGRRLVTILLAVLIPTLLATAVAMVLLWPHGQPKTGLQLQTSAGGQVVKAQVRATSATTCKAESSDRLPDGTIPATAVCAMMDRLRTGPGHRRHGRRPTAGLSLGDLAR